MWPPGLGQFYSGRKMPRDQDMGEFRHVGSEVDYGDGYDPTQILPYVEKIQYVGLQLPQPFLQWLDGRPAVDSQLISLLDGERGSDWRGTK